MTAACLICLCVLPALSGFLLGTALALPVAAALILATLLCFSAAALWLLRPQEIETVPSDAADLVFDICPGLLLICDGQGTIMKSGGRDRTLLPASRRDPRGLSIAELVHVSDRIAVAQALMPCVRAGKAKGSRPVSSMVSIRKAGASSPPCVSNFLPPPADDDALQNVLVQIIDIAEAVQLREDIIERTAEALSAHEAKSRFLAAVSHELRTPLNAILGFSDVLAGEYFGALQNDRQREYVSLIRQSGAHLLSVVNTMLDMSRIEAGRYELITEPSASPKRSRPAVPCWICRPAPRA